MKRLISWFRRQGQGAVYAYFTAKVAADRVAPCCKTAKGIRRLAVGIAATQRRGTLNQSCST